MTEYKQKKAALAFLQMALCESGEPCKLQLSEDESIVTITYNNGYQKQVNVGGDSSKAMMIDVLYKA